MLSTYPLPVRKILLPYGSISSDSNAISTSLSCDSADASSNMIEILFFNVIDISLHKCPSTTCWFDKDSNAVAFVVALDDDDDDDDNDDDDDDDDDDDEEGLGF